MTPIERSQDLSRDGWDRVRVFKVVGLQSPAQEPLAYGGVRACFPLGRDIDLAL